MRCRVLSIILGGLSHHQQGKTSIWSLYITATECESHLRSPSRHKSKIDIRRKTSVRNNCLRCWPPILKLSCMWRAWLPLPRWSRPFSTINTLLKARTAYEAKLAARKPPPTVLEVDLEESFIKGSPPKIPDLLTARRRSRRAKNQQIFELRSITTYPHGHCDQMSGIAEFGGESANCQEVACPET